MTKVDNANGDLPTENGQNKTPSEPTERTRAADTATATDISDDSDAADVGESELMPDDAAGGKTVEGKATADELAEDKAEAGEDEEPTEAEIIAQLKEELAEAIAAKAEAEDRRKYEAAEFQNIRKRQEQRLSEAISRANTDLIQRLLPILDDFELAFRNVPESLASDEQNGDSTGEEAWLAGFEQIHKKLLNVLEEQGVTPIDASGAFDPELHEAILSEPSDEVESGHIIDVLRTGYQYHGQVLRAAMVRVAA